MSKSHTICASLFLLILSLTNVQAQSDIAKSATPEALTITAAASDERVRFAAPASVVQIRVEVYASNGKKLFDNELRGGNVLDWHLQNGQAEPLSDDTYLCVVTVKNLSGRITQRIGSVRVEKSVASLQPAAASQMTAQQSDAIGPVEENAPLTILNDGEPQTATVIAHNGDEGQIIRGRGALSFRIGDFFRGKDTEQMRLTVEGNLGIGITHPQARLDVDGLIRTSKGIVFPDGTIQTTAANGASDVQASDPNLVGGNLSGSTNLSASSSGKNGKAKGKNKVSPELLVNEDLTINGNIIFTPSLFRDITMQNNNSGLRFYGAQFPLTNSPAAAAIQFWGNNSGFPGQAYIDTGANDNAAVIFRTAITGGTITERMRITAAGNVGVGTTTPGFPLTVNGVINSTTGGFRFPDGTMQTTAASGGGGGGIPIGTVIAYAGPAVPAGWLVCDGAAVSRTQNAVLFAAIGTSWGSGDGSTTFNLPDLSGRFLRGVDRDGNGTPSASPRDPDRDTREAANSGGNIGNNVGSIQMDEFASHSHNAINNRPFLMDFFPLGGGGAFTTYKFLGGAQGGGLPLTPTTGNTGGSETRPKNAYVIWIIKAN
jgi:hypothetical protein